MIFRNIPPACCLSAIALGITFSFTSCEGEDELITEKDISSSIEVPIKFDGHSERTNSFSGYYETSEGHHYYIRQSGDDIIWFAEDPEGEWAQVFVGHLTDDNGYQVVNGATYDVPKGRRETIGSQWAVIGGIPNPFLHRKVAPSYLPGTRAEGFGSRGNSGDLTAKWTSNNGGVYYINQIGDKVIWFGEQDYRVGKPVWANVGVGKRTGDTITLDWADVPKGRNGGKGSITLKVSSADKITLTTSSGGFGGTVWTR